MTHKAQQQQRVSLFFLGVTEKNNNNGENALDERGKNNNLKRVSSG